MQLDGLRWLVGAGMTDRVVVGPLGRTEQREKDRAKKRGGRRLSERKNEKNEWQVEPSAPV